VIVDQSFLSLGDDAHELGSALPDNAIRVRSLTKDHAFPGVRVGYAIATAALVASLEAARPTWTTSAAAQAAAIAACELDDFVADSRRRLIADREALAAALRACGLAPEPSRAPFLAVAVRDAGAARDALLGAHAIQVRHCQSFGLPDHLRVAALRGADRDRLIAAVRALGLAPASVAAARVDRQSSSCQPTPSARSKRLSS
jgi:histidinol-phosphate/aromatic aminotransferase/cobyric acid decarboxylase-like protein